MTDLKQMTEDEWSIKYKPVENHLLEHKGTQMFETYGKELNHVVSTCTKTPNTVWTLLDCDGTLIISPGFWRINRLGYFITEVPHQNEDIEVIY